MNYLPVTKQAYYLSDLVLQNRFAKALEEGVARYPVCRELRFAAGKGELENASIEEMADDVLCDAAYPELKDGVRAFIARYLDAPVTVLVLQGPPGTGKTRLIRAILGEMSRRKGEEAECLYT